MRCAETPRECLTEHISRSLANARTGKHAGSIRADCPACKRASLTVTCGDVVRFVWTCHAGCDDEAVRKAMVKARVREDCLPPRRSGKRRQEKRRRTDAEIVRELLVLLDEPVNGNAFRLRAAMLLLDADASTAADKLGIPERPAAAALPGLLSTGPGVRPAGDSSIAVHVNLAQIMHHDHA